MGFLDAIGGQNMAQAVLQAVKSGQPGPLSPQTIALVAPFANLGAGQNGATTAQVSPTMIAPQNIGAAVLQAVRNAQTAAMPQRPASVTPRAGSDLSALAWLAGIAAGGNTQDQTLPSQASALNPQAIATAAPMANLGMGQNGAVPSALDPAAIAAAAPMANLQGGGGTSPNLGGGGMAAAVAPGLKRQAMAKVAQAMQAARPGNATSGAAAALDPSLLATVAPMANLGTGMNGSADPQAGMATQPGDNPQPAIPAMPAQSPQSQESGWSAAIPAIAMALAGLSRNPNAQGNTLQSYMAGRTIQQQNQLMKEREDTGKAMQLIMQYDNPMDAMSAMAKSGLAPSPEVLSKLVQYKWKASADRANAMAKFYYDTALKGMELSGQQTLENLKGKNSLDVAKLKGQSGMDEAKLKAEADKEVARINAGAKEAYGAAGDTIFNKRTGEIAQPGTKREDAQKAALAKLTAQLAQNDLTFQAGKPEEQAAALARHLAAAKRLLGISDNAASGGAASKQLTPEKAQEYLSRAGGDPDKARAQARLDGWEF